MLLVISLSAALLVAVPGMAGAHAELLEASPQRSSTVGGTVDEISLQFVGLAHPGDHEVLILDPLGSRVEILSLEQDFNRLNVSIAPLTIEGEYIVSHQTDGADGDLGTGSYVFTYDADADPPTGIEHRQETPGVDWVTVALIAVTVLGALAWLAYVANRLRKPPPDHTDADAHADADEYAQAEADASSGALSADSGSADLNELGDDDEGLAGGDVGFATGVTKRKVGRDDE